MVKRSGTHDPRQDPDEETLDETAERFRVDRVFAGAREAPVRRSPPPQQSYPPIDPVTGEIARPRTTTTSNPSIAAAQGQTEDAELLLRRQLTKLQRQLAEAQREVSN